MHNEDDGPLSEYPEAKLRAVNVLRSIICVLTVIIYFIVAFLMYQIGIKQSGRRHDSNSFLTNDADRKKSRED